MINSIFVYLISIVATALASACLLRLLMQYQKTSFDNPVGQFVMAISNWLVLPLRRIIPAVGPWDMASLVAAFAVMVAKSLLFWLLSGGEASPVMLPLAALLGLLDVALQGLLILMLAYALMSWLQPQQPVAAVLSRLCEPLLAPIRSILPSVGGVDLSPIVFVVVLQIARMLLGI